jgi:hypothetical protein
MYAHKIANYAHDILMSANLLPSDELACNLHYLWVCEINARSNKLIFWRTQLKCKPPSSLRGKLEDWVFRPLRCWLSFQKSHQSKFPLIWHLLNISPRFTARDLLVGSSTFRLTSQCEQIAAELDQTRSHATTYLSYFGNRLLGTSELKIDFAWD